MKSSTENKAKHRHPSHKQNSPGSQLLTITRRFDAGVEALWRAFSTESNLKQWWWPKNYSVSEARVVFRQGGQFFIGMEGPDKKQGWMISEIQEFVPHELIVMTDNFADKDGRVISPKEAGMPMDWGPSFITFEFEGNGDHRSELRLYHEGMPDEMRTDCMNGWNESFDKLDAFLRGRN